MSHPIKVLCVGGPHDGARLPHVACEIWDGKVLKVGSPTSRYSTHKLADDLYIAVPVFTAIEDAMRTLVARYPAKEIVE